MRCTLISGGATRSEFRRKCRASLLATSFGGLFTNAPDSTLYFIGFPRIVWEKAFVPWINPETGPDGGPIPGDGVNPDVQIRFSQYFCQGRRRWEPRFWEPREAWARLSQDD